MSQDLAKSAADRGIRYFLISFVDLFGVLRAKLVPASAIGQMQRDGAAFAGFATHLDLTPADPDMFAIPDPASLIQMPWKPEIGWLAADLHMGGEPLEHAPRHVLKRQIAAAAEHGYRLKTGVEAEFFVLRADGRAVADEADRQAKPCYDQAALLRRYELIRAISDAMLELGWTPYQSDHEDANGQFEMNWAYDDALVTADRHVFFKFMVKELAGQHGLRATFMPKPFMHLTGNGCHAHVSLWDREGDINLFHDPEGELGLSALAYHFLGGVLAHAEPLSALFTPTVNSFKRINAAPTVSGATWSPNAISYGGNNRTHMVRIPEPGRFEIRLMDGAANPYLLQAGHARRRTRWDRTRARSRQAARSQHVRAGCRSGRHPTAASQPARRAARVRQLGGIARGAGRRLCRLLRQTSYGPVARLRATSDRMGARAHPRCIRLSRARVIVIRGRDSCRNNAARLVVYGIIL